MAVEPRGTSSEPPGPCNAKKRRVRPPLHFSVINFSVINCFATEEMRHRRFISLDAWPNLHSDCEILQLN